MAEQPAPAGKEPPAKEKPTPKDQAEMFRELREKLSKL